MNDISINLFEKNFSHIEDDLRYDAKTLALGSRILEPRPSSATCVLCVLKQCPASLNLYLTEGNLQPCAHVHGQTYTFPHFACLSPDLRVCVTNPCTHNTLYLYRPSFLPSVSIQGLYTHVCIAPSSSPDHPWDSSLTLHKAVLLAGLQTKLPILISFY